MLRALVVKELKARHKRSALGFLWTLITPLALTGAYLFVFVYVYKTPKPDFILFLLSGVFPWQYLNVALTAATNSLVESAPLIRSVPCPRFLIPMSVVLAHLMNFLMALGLLCVILVASGRPLWLSLHWLMVAIALETALCIGLSLSLSIWNVYLRDVRQLIGIAIVVLFFATPIVYELSQVPDPLKGLIFANPMAPIIETYRAALYSSTTPDLGMLGLGAAETLALFSLGWFVFSRYSPQLAKEV